MSAYDEDLLDEEDEEMPLTERDLADDAQWKIIQKNTFTRWANEHLKTVSKGINELETDFSDGLRLVALVEVLSGKKFKFVNRRPNFRTQKLENVTMALEFLERDEGIRIVNIDSGDIVDSKLKLILGLIWTLILHYSISMPMWEGEEPQPQEGGPTPKQRLLNWIQGKVPDLPIKGFTNDWNDGKAIGALVDALAPGLCPDWEDWDPKKAKKNAKEAMDAAEKWLDIPQLIKPEEITNPKVDELSMMTYLSQFPKAKLKPGAPLRPRQNAKKIRAYGPGIEPKGNKVGAQAKFTVETFSAGQGNLDILILDPKGKQNKCDIKDNKDRNQTYSCMYVPQMEGEYRVIIKFGEKEINRSPFKVLVEGAAGDASKVTASGPGLEKTGVVVSKKTYFEVFTKDAGKGNVEVSIMDPSGHRDHVKATITPGTKEGVYMVEYTPTEVGLYSINISFSGTAIPKSPYGVNVGASINAKAVYATGRGIQPRGVRVNQKAEFKVHTKEAGKAEVKVQIIGPGGAPIKCDCKPSKTEEGVYECLYIPPKIGQYVINITFGGQHITKSPFRVDVGPEKFTKVVAFGPGLEGGVVNQPACFTVETNGETGALGFSIEGPSQAKIDCKDNGDGSADVTYWPTAPGEYAVHIMCNEEDIPQAPYMAQIQPATTAFDASKVTAKGPGLEKDGVTINTTAEFTVDAKKAGKAQLHITCIDANYKAVPVDVKDNKDGTYSCKYNPKNPVRHTIIITWGTVGIPKSPYRVNVGQPCKPGNVKVYGPGVERGVKTWVKTYFTVDCRTAGPGDVAIALTDTNGKDVPVNTIDNKDGTFTVEYEPKIPGMYTVAVYFAEKEIPKSPIKVKVESSIDLSKVTVKGLETPIPLGETRQITIITSGQPKKDAPCKVTVTMPSKKTVEIPVKKSPEFGYTCDFKPTEKGPHTVTVEYDKKPAPGSPFPVEVTTAGIVVKGLDEPIEVGETRPITIDTSTMPKKKDVPCKASVTNPKGKTVELPLKKSPEGFTTTWKPDEKGPHKVTIDYDGKPVPKSPFPVEVVPKGAKPKTVITVKGLETPVETGEKRIVTIVTKNPTPGAVCKITITTPKGRTSELKHKAIPEGFEAIFTPWDSGVHKVKIEYDTKEVPGSPFNVEVFKINISAVVVKGLEKPIPLGETRKISIITKDTGKSDLPCKVTVVTPKGVTSELPTEKTPDGYECKFTPEVPGDHKVKVEYSTKEVPKSPFTVSVESSEKHPSKVGKPEEVTPDEIKPKKDHGTKSAPSAGPVTVKGLETPVNPGEKRPVTVDTTKSPKKDAPVKLTMTTPKGRSSELKTKPVKDGVETTFSSWDKGIHKVKVEYDGKEIPESPFEVLVEKIDVSKVTVKGLDKPIQLGETRQVSILTIETGKVDAPCTFIITTPSGKTEEIPTEKTPEGYDVKFTPKEKGKYTVKITYAVTEVPDSPFTVHVQTVDLSSVKVTGLDKPIMVGEKRKITIITKPVGKGDLPCKVHVTNPKGVTTELFTSKNPDGQETFFTPTDLGPHKVKVEVAGEEVPGSEFKVNVTKFELKVEVEGLDTPITAGEKRLIKVLAAAPAKPNRFAPEPTCKVTVTNPKGRNLEPKVDKTSTGFETIFSSNEPGPHVFKIEHNGKELPDSPYTCEVEKMELRKVEVKGLDSPIEVGETRPIQVVTTEAGGKPDTPCKVTAVGPKGDTKELPTKKIPEGFETSYAPLEVGPHKVKVEYANKEVPKSPFPVEVKPKSKDAGKPVPVEVKGLETPVTVGEKRPITVKSPKPDAPTKITSTTPKGKATDIPTKKISGGVEALFAPLEEGPYKIKIEHAGKEVPDSPYSVKVMPKLDLAKVEVKGLETPILLGEKRPITVVTKNTGNPDAPCKVTTSNPKGKPTDCPTKKTPEGYETLFAPLEDGPHLVKVEVGNKEVPKSPYKVDVQPKVDLNKVQIKGLETPVEVDEFRKIILVTKDTGNEEAPCKVSALTPEGRTSFLPTKKIPDGYESTFNPKSTGPHKVKVEFANQEIPKSPVTVVVEGKLNIKKVEVKGLEKPILLGESRPIIVDTASTGKPELPCKVLAKGPTGPYVELPTKKVPEGYECVYKPDQSGPNSVKVEYAEQEVPKSPYHVQVDEKVDESNVEIKGLESPIKVGEPRPITVMTSTTGKPDAPCRVFATNPKGKTTELPTRKIPEGYTATLAPQETGPHRVNVEFNGKEVPKSPFNVMAEPAIDFNKVKVTGLEKPVEVGEIRPVTVDTAETGVVDAPCQVTSTNPVGQVRELPLQKTPKGYQAQFAPLEEGPHQVAVKYAGREVPKSPFPVKAVPQGRPADKVKAYGPGLTAGSATKPCSFTIDTRDVTQPGGLGVTVEGPAESKIECRDNQNGTCDVTYHPTVPGDYSINVTYADEHIPNSPFKPRIQPSGDIDVSNVRAFGPGLEPGVFLESPTGFTVDAKSVTPTGEGKIRAIVTSPSGTKTESLVTNNNDGTYDVLYTPFEQGPNTLDVTYEDIPIPQSPVKVNATPGHDSSRVRAYGPGLEGGITEAPQVFTVDVKGAGQGGLALAIDGPAETQIQCKDNRDGTCTVEYVPVKKGDYDITVKFADEHIPGSPFNVGVQNEVNPSKVKCYGPGLEPSEVKAFAPATFTVDATEAGEAPLDVKVTDSVGRTKPAEIRPVEAGKYEATYYPVEEGKCTVDVKYANQSVPKSPFTVPVHPGVDASKVRLSGDGVKPTVLASMPVQFVIDTRDAGVAELDVVIQRPDGTFIRPMIQDNGDGTFTVQYTPEDCGPYNISITFGGQPVTGSPLKTTAIPTGDAMKCKITDGLQQTIPVDKETVISVDASEAGTGKVTCRIRSPQGTELDIDIVENVDGTFSILFTPAFPGDYSISIKFGGQSIPSGDYVVQVGEDLISADTVDATHAAAPGSGLYQPQEFCIPVGPIFNFVTAYIEMPSGKKAYPKIEDNKDGTVTVRYQPQETGLHSLHLCYNQQEIQGSPFQFHVDAINSGFVTAYGPGLSHGVVNVPAEFTIVTKDAGAGGLSLAIEGPSKTEIKCKDNGDGTCTVTYLPMAPGEYNITVKFADKNISGSPFVAKVTAGEPKQRAQIGRSSEVSLKVTETDITNLTASICSPSGTEEPCMLKRLPNGHLGISFTPRETGDHLVNVYRDGQHIANSPFKINVGAGELGNASKVKVSGKGLTEGMANEVNEFIVDTREAGYGGLSLSIEGPSKADIECHDNEDGTCRVTYKPTEPGTYVINIKFADEHVPNSPFKVKIGGEPSERITERIMRHREAADVTHVGSECELSLKIPGTSPFDMTASVTSPNGVTELCDVVSLDDCHYSIKFVPKEMGIHTVSVKHKDMHIPGSPFQFTVGPIAGGGAHKVHAAGLGLVKGEVEQPNEFNIYTREAGAGGLSIACEGPSKAEVDFEDRKDGSCGVTYSVTEPGEYLISIKFNDEHIPDSPFRVPITPSIGDAKKISVQSLQSKGLAINKPCAFVVNFNGAPKGKLTARVVSPSGSEDDALVQEIDDGQYAVRFIPRENGPHLVYVTFDGCQIPDSPFRIQVGTVHADPGMVQAYGDGLKQGKTGQTAKFIVNTVNAGSGALAVTVEGPSKVKLECSENEDGYEFQYTPTAPGDYLITIRYAGTNIAGSPYKARIEGPGKPSGYSEQASVVVETVTKTSTMSKFASLPPFQSDASKVTVDGNGLKKGYRNKQCTFNVDTSQAGNNMLFLGMVGPKGPCEELCVKHYPGMPYKITYLVKERGDYMLAVKWGEEHIPGSPFYVRVE